MRHCLLCRRTFGVIGLLLLSRFSWAMQDLVDIQAQLAHEPKVALQAVTLKLEALNDETLSINHEVWFAYKEVEITAQIKLGLLDEAKASALVLYAQYDADGFPIYRAKTAFLLAVANQSTSNSQQKKQWPWWLIKMNLSCKRIYLLIWDVLTDTKRNMRKH